jgi:hypothetical protein
MNLPRFMRRMNRVFTNPLMRTVAWRVRPLAVVHHVGRKSGRPYRAPVVAFGAAEAHLPAAVRFLFRTADLPGYVPLDRGGGGAKRPAGAGS